jgi:hypothetical protein
LYIQEVVRSLGLHNNYKQQGLPHAARAPAPAVGVMALKESHAKSVKWMEKSNSLLNGVDFEISTKNIFLCHCSI